MTSGFVAATEAHRRLLKHPELPYFVVPHPIVSMDEDALKVSADAIFEAISTAIARHSATPNSLGTRSEG